MDLGSRLGKYEIIEQIGSGGMGAVYRARDAVLDREVAIKVIAKSIDSEDVARRFYEEARASARLLHPNIISIFDFGEDRGTKFFVMEFVHGQTLEHMLAQTPEPIPLATTRSILEQVASALDFAHSHGIVHRDVKPSNIMIDTARQRVLLMDFGIARLNESENTRVTRPGQLVGTVRYMAPERIVRKEAGDRSDQYALGLIAFEMLTGQLPFSGDTDYELMTAHVQMAPPLVTQFRRDLPASLAAAVARALAKDPNQRFSRVSEFVEAAFGTAGSTSETPNWLSRVFGRLFRRPAKASTRPIPASRHPTPLVVDPVPSRPGQSSNDATVIEPAPFGGRSRHATGTISLLGAPAGDSTRVFSVVGGGQAERVVEDRPRIRLVFKSCADPLRTGSSVEVKTVPFRIGRSAADLSIAADDGMSRNHAEIDWINGTYVVRDSGSRNGTFVQGRRVRTEIPEVLRFGATIRLSSATELMLVSDEDTNMPDLTGAVLDGRYTLLKLIRTSGKAALYEATDARLPHKVAIKALSPVLARYPGYLEDFQHEARMAAELQHPHIARVLDSGAARLPPPWASACNYVCLELMAEGDLSDRLRKQSVLPLAETLGILDGVSDALEYAHSMGVVHRGLKPSSILFSRNGFAFVSDFAFATRSSDPNRRMFVGAPDFLAPEQWEDAVITPAADQYSLSALAYLMLAGSPPFHGQQDPDFRRANLLRGPSPAHEEAARNGNADVPAPVSEVLARALSPDPASRYPSIREFFLQLKSAGQGSIPRVGPPRVFISYQRDTSAGWAILFSRELEQKHGITAFVDTQRLDSAVRFPVKLTRAIKDCDVFVCLLSDKTLNSQWVREEIRLAWENSKPMVPIFQESFEPPAASEKLDGHIEALVSYDGIHLLDRRNIYVDDAISRLASIVEQSVRQIRG